MLRNALLRVSQGRIVFPWPRGGSAVSNREADIHVAPLAIRQRPLTSLDCKHYRIRVDGGQVGQLPLLDECEL